MEPGVQPAAAALAYEALRRATSAGPVERWELVWGGRALGCQRLPITLALLGDLFALVATGLAYARTPGAPSCFTISEAVAHRQRTGGREPFRIARMGLWLVFLIWRRPLGLFGCLLGTWLGGGLVCLFPIPPA
mmetsp:Transcript_112505/g.312986  ORF Transcript_112505/g.312986 Transcript_112505/m.312986 type:complete len:134 (-) Transcript_112505:8-409(-)